MFRRVFTIFLVFFSFLPPSSLVNGSICLSQFPTAIPNNYFPSEFAEMLASHLFLFPNAPPPQPHPSRKNTKYLGHKNMSTDHRGWKTPNETKQTSANLFLLILVHFLIRWTECLYKYYNLYKLIVVSCQRKAIIDVNVPQSSLNTNVSWSSILLLLLVHIWMFAAI